MSGMTERRLKTIEGRTETYRQTLLEIDCYYSSVDLIAEIRRLREENERLEDVVWEHAAFKVENENLRKERDSLQKELKGIGAEQYYTLQAHYKNKARECRELENQNAELAEVLRHANSYISNGYDLGYIDDREGYTDHTLSMIEKIIRKYGLEGTE